MSPPRYGQGKKVAIVTELSLDSVKHSRRGREHADLHLVTAGLRVERRPHQHAVMRPDLADAAAVQREGRALEGVVELDLGRVRTVPGDEVAGDAGVVQA